MTPVMTPRRDPFHIAPPPPRTNYTARVLVWWCAGCLIGGITITLVIWSFCPWLVKG